MPLPRVQPPKDISGEERKEFFEKRGSPDPTPLENKPGYKYLLKSEDLTEYIKNEKRPLYLDIGAGMGRFLMEESEKHPENSYIGIDPDYQCVKKNLTKLDNRERRNVSLNNCRFFYGSVYHLLDKLPEQCIDVAYINYPDPWFKKRHLKRRLVTAKLFETLYSLLKPEARVYVQTDIDDYAEFIDEEFKAITQYKIQYDALEKFKDLAGTLYQEKAKLKDHNRHCYLLKKI
jgi:tRNA (guanine-N7-)-methyltransferase